MRPNPAASAQGQARQDRQRGSLTGGQAEEKGGSWVAVATRALEKANQATDTAKGQGKGGGVHPDDPAKGDVRSTGAASNVASTPEVIIITDVDEPSGRKSAADAGGKPGEDPATKAMCPEDEIRHEEEQLHKIQAAVAAIELVQGLRKRKGEEGMFSGLSSLLGEMREHEEGTKARLQEIKEPAPGHTVQPARAKKDLPAEVKLRNLRNRQERRARAKERLVQERDEARNLQELVWQKVRELEYRISEMEEQDADFEEEIRELAAAVAEEAGLEVCSKDESDEECSDDNMEGYDQDDDDGGYGHGGRQRIGRRRARKAKGAMDYRTVPEALQAPALCQQLLSSIQPKASPAAAKVHEAVKEWMGTIGKTVAPPGRAK